LHCDHAHIEQHDTFSISMHKVASSVSCASIITAHEVWS
jgi:hypothetical protein